MPVVFVYGASSSYNSVQDRNEYRQALPHAIQIELTGDHNVHLQSARELAACTQGLVSIDDSQENTMVTAEVQDLA